MNRGLLEKLAWTEADRDLARDCELDGFARR